MITDNQRKMMIHALGNADPDMSYRNSYQVNPLDVETREEWEDLVEKGAAEVYGQDPRIFQVTPAGQVLLCWKPAHLCIRGGPPIREIYRFTDIVRLVVYQRQTGSMLAVTESQFHKRFVRI